MIGRLYYEFLPVEQVMSDFKNYHDKQLKVTEFKANYDALGPVVTIVQAVINIKH